jgi:hypothetical protein
LLGERIGFRGGDLGQGQGCEGVKHNRERRHRGFAKQDARPESEAF